MKCLSVKNPHAYFIVSGIKDIENRTRRTHYRGRIAIHATKVDFAWPSLEDMPGEVVEQLRADYEVRRPYDDLGPWSKGYMDLVMYAERFLKIEDQGQDDFEAELKNRVKALGLPFVYSAIIGEVDIVDCIEDSDSPWAESGNFHWILDRPVLYDRPIIGVKGRLGLWDYISER